MSVSGVGYEPRGELRPVSGQAPTLEHDLQQLLMAASLCNNSRLNPPTAEHPQWTCLGDQTEAALRVLALKGGLDEEELLHSLPAHPRAALRRPPQTDEHHPPQARQGTMAFVKGAPREVLQLCTHLLRMGQP